MKDSSRGANVNAARRAAGRLVFGHEALVRRFYERLRAGDPPPVSGEDGRDVVDLLEQLWAALARSAPTSPPA